MTENEALKSGKALYENITLKGNNVIPVAKYIEFVKMANEALEEIQQYRAIGTVEELKALKEKNVAKKVNIQQWMDTKCDCGYEFSKHHGDGYYSIPYEKQTKYCPECGQKLDWQ